MYSILETGRASFGLRIEITSMSFILHQKDGTSKRASRPLSAAGIKTLLRIDVPKRQKYVLIGPQINASCFLNTSNQQNREAGKWGDDGYSPSAVDLLKRRVVL